MRLSVAQQQAILDVTREFYGDVATVRLFGSRADDSARGGDIDLLIETPLPYDEAVSRKLRFLVGLAKRLGDRRVDVVVSSPDSPERSIVRVAEETGVLIS